MKIPVLPPIPLRSLGDGLQESLHHYILRMADRLCLTRLQFLKFLFRDSVESPREIIQLSGWIGPQSDFRKILSALQSDTCLPDLQTGTFWALSPVLGRGGIRSRPIRGNGRAWCPKCYLDWDDDFSCEPLVWAFELLTYCPIHLVALETSCWFCHSAQPFTAPFSTRRVCTSCGLSLGHQGELRDWGWIEQWTTASLVELTKWIQNPELKPVSLSSYRLFCKKSSVGENGKTLPNALRNYVRDGKSQSRATIGTLLNWSAFKGVSIQTILESPVEAANASNFEFELQFESVPFSRRTVEPDVEKVATVLEIILAGDEMIPPIAFVCSTFDIWSGIVKDHHPGLHYRYIERHKRQITSVGPYRFNRAFNTALQSFSENPKVSISSLVETVGRLRNMQPSDAKIVVHAALGFFRAVEKCNLAEGLTKRRGVQFRRI